MSTTSMLTQGLYTVIQRIFEDTEVAFRPFPPLSNNNRAACVCGSHAVRTGLENLGDEHMYLCIGFLLRRLCPGRARAFYHAATEVLTCNATFGWYLRRLRVYHEHPLNATKEGGDVFETLIGAVADEYGLRGLQDWVTSAFGPFVVAFAQFDSPTLPVQILPQHQSLIIPGPNRIKTSEVDTLLTTIGFQPEASSSEPLVFPLRNAVVPSTEIQKGKERM
ncbi:hypothetical protein C8R47DRAFT_1162238 [Mycena vitilis]|nr:hypothetical protein C8R47DRAFT_1162238 [Mycena vitilis]